jgi:hypothetical protein
MSDFLAFNLNHYVLVKVLPKGFEAMRAHYSYMPAEWQKPLEYYQAQANEAGFVKFQLWEFMQVFGPLITLATEGLFETDVLFDSVDLKPVNQPTALPK